MQRIVFFLLVCSVMASCFQPERKCTNFQTGSFEFEAFINGELQKTQFVRTDSIEIDHYKGSSDTSKVRWLNDCEYILTNLNPKNRAEQKPIHIKILTTKGNTYTFEYGLVGESLKQKGTAVRVGD